MPGREPRFELLTPRGRGGVAVLVLRGSERWQRVRPFLRTAGGAVPARAERPTRGELHCGGSILDDVLLVDRPELGCLEIHLHGSPAVLATFESAVGGFVEVPPSPAERLLRGAASRAQLALALEQQAGDLAAWLAHLAQRPEGHRAAALRAALRRSRLAMALCQARRLVICGDQNAGKSTLMNRLLFQERVLTGELPGLTRDPVREAVMLDGYPYELVDTAGEGRVRASLDRSARELARRERRHGLLLLVVDGTRPPSKSARAIRNDHTLVLRSKADLPQAPWPDDFSADLQLSLSDPDRADTVRTAVGTALRVLRDLPPAGPVGGVAALDRDELLRIEAALADCAGDRREGG